MADATSYPSLTELTYFQWSNPTAPTPTLARSVATDDTTVYFSAAPKDKDLAVITDPFLMGAKIVTGTYKGYTLLIYCPNGADGTDGLSATGVTVGIAHNGLDYTTADSDLAVSAPAGSPIFCADTAVLQSLMVSALQGSIATGGSDLRVGAETDVDITFYFQNGDANPPFIRFNSTNNNIEFSADGVSTFVPGTSGTAITGGDGITVTSGDIDVDLTDTTVFVSTSSGVGDSGKVVRLDVSGEIPTDFVKASPLADYISDVSSSASAIDAAVSASTVTVTAGEAIDGSSTPQAIFISRGTSDSDAIPFYRQVDAGTKAEHEVQGVDFEAQTFTTNAYNTEVTKVSLWLTKTGSPSGNFRMRIYAVDGSNHPTGSSLAEKTVTASSISTTDLVKQDFTLSSTLSLDPSTTYAIVCDVTSGDASNYIAWFVNTTAPYSGGNRVSSTDAGSTWSTDASDDFLFEVHAYEAQTAGEAYMSDQDAGFRGACDGVTTSNVAASASLEMRATGIQDSYTGLTTGARYYVDSTAGAVTTSKDGMLIGTALSTTEILLQKENRFVAIDKQETDNILSNSAAETSEQYLVANCGFEPSRVELYINGYCQTGAATNVREIRFAGNYIDSQLRGNAMKFGSTNQAFTNDLEGMDVTSLAITDGGSGITLTFDELTSNNGGFYLNASVANGAAGTGQASLVAVCYY